MLASRQCWEGMHDGSSGFAAVCMHAHQPSVPCIVQVQAIPNKAALVVASAAVRFCNTFVGSAQWVWLARRVGLQ